MTTSTDFFELGAMLDESSILCRDTTRQFVDEKVIPDIADCYEHARFPEAWTQEMASLGLFGLKVPAAYGGSGASAEAYGVVCQELERGDSGLRSLVSVQNSLCCYPILRYGSEEQKQHYLPAMVQGSQLGCFGLTEPDSGSDPASMKTVARKTQAGWKLTGHKTWITQAPVADLAVVWARSEQGMLGFIVKLDQPGVTRYTIDKKGSLRASHTGGLIFDEVELRETDRLPGACDLGAPLSCLSQARYGIAWGAIGAAVYCYESALQYAHDRVQFGKPLVASQLIQKDLVRMLCEITKAQALNLQLARLVDKQAVHFTQISMAKMNACRVALDVARQARNLLGANGVSLEYHVIRHLSNLESVFTYEGTDHIHHLIIGRGITGVSAF